MGPILHMYYSQFASKFRIFFLNLGSRMQPIDVSILQILYLCYVPAISVRGKDTKDVEWELL